MGANPLPPVEPISQAKKTDARIPSTPAGTVMTREYIQTVARFAYLWGWPLVNNLNRALAGGETV